MSLAASLLTELPTVDRQLTGWPWTETADGHLADSKQWPRLTIITPSFNQAAYIEETIRSVLLQGYPNLEYLVIDGDSSDNSVEIIRKYSAWLTYWVSEPDRGQTHAINKGLARATGDFVAWLNSDDVYAPNALFAIAEALAQNPEAVWIYGEADLIREDGSLIEKNYSKPYDKQIMLREGNPVPQPSAFIRRQTLQEVGGLDESLHFTMDYDLWFRLGEAGKVVYLEKKLALMRMYPEAKTSSGDHRFFTEVREVAERYGGSGLPVLHREWLIQIHWRKLYAAYAADDWASGQRELAYIMQQVNGWQTGEELAQRLLDRLWAMVVKRKAAEAEVAQVGLKISGHLPADVPSPETVGAQLMSRLHQALAFRYAEQGKSGQALSALGSAAWWDKRCLLNRGLWVIAFRSLLRVFRPTRTVNNQP